MGNTSGPLSNEITELVESEVLSSDDEARRAQSLNKKPHFRRRPKKPLLPLLSADGKTVVLTPREGSMDGDSSTLLPKEIKPFADMLQVAPWLDLDASKPDAKCKGLSAESKQAMNEAKMAQNKENPMEASEFHPIFQSLLKTLKRPEISVQVHGRRLTQKEILQALQNGTAELATVSCETESALLGEAGTFALKSLQGAMRTFPACLNEEKGCFMYDRYKKLGRSWMTDAEFDAFMKQNRIPPRRICIICHRMILGTIFSTMAAEGDIITVNQDYTLLQQFCNKLECQGGYKESFVTVVPNGPKTRGMYGPFVKFQPKYLREFIDENGAWRLDQSVLCWHPDKTIIPEIGETNRDFH